MIRGPGQRRKSEICSLRYETACDRLELVSSTPDCGTVIDEDGRDSWESLPRD